MGRSSKSFFTERKASVSIEFAIVFPFLIVLFLFVLEFSRIMFIGSALDLMTAEITRKTAISESQGINYAQRLENIIEDELPLWPYLTNANDFETTVTYCKSVQEVLDDVCISTSSKDSHIILFKLEYQYYAVFNTLFSRMLDSSLTKKTIVYREFYL